jgi:hypothetical protein
MTADRSAPPHSSVFQRVPQPSQVGQQLWCLETSSVGRAARYRCASALTGQWIRAAVIADLEAAIRPQA